MIGWTSNETLSNNRAERAGHPVTTAPEVFSQHHEVIAMPKTKHIVDGNTYPVKEKLKSLGCKWDPEEKYWYTYDRTTARKARNIVRKENKWPSSARKDDKAGEDARRNRGHDVS